MPTALSGALSRCLELVRKREKRGNSDIFLSKLITENGTYPLFEAQDPFSITNPCLHVFK